MGLDDDVTRLPEDGDGGRASFVAGEDFGEYRIVRLLGRGGMGEVYEVEHRELNTRHAIKVINHEIVARADSAERFRREARVMAQLRHAGIVHVDDFRQSQGRAWIRMELVEGGSLGDLLRSRGGKLAEAEAREVLRQVLEALAYAHAEGVVHRDLKPANILLEGKFSHGGTGGTESLSGSSFNDENHRVRRAAVRDLRCKIADFGLVRLAGEQWVQSQVQLTVARSMTLSGGETVAGPSAGLEKGTSTKALLGTFAYMSPEQKKGEEADARSDLYAVGLMAYQMLTGEESLGMLRPSELVEGLDMEWDRWIIRATHPKRESRFADTGAMLAALPGRPLQANSVEPISESPRPAPSVPEPMPASEPAPAPTFKPISAPPPVVEEIKQEPMPEKPTSEPEPDYARRRRLLWGALAAVGLIWLLVAYPRQAQNSQPVVDIQTGKQVRQVELPGGVKLEMVWIGPGEFTMGSPSNESGRDSDEGPQTRVRLSKGYWLGKYEVTQAQYQALMGSNPSNWTGSNLPVEGVSWNDAMEFCKRLSEAERRAGRLPEGYAYTLPTEAQWEYAARAGTTGAHAGNLDSMGWYDKNSGGSTKPVGQKVPNAWGLYDMHGNVWEWCADWYASSYPGGSVTDPSGPSTGSFRVRRGGSWYFSAQYCRSAIRLWDSPGFRFNFLGFRLALSSVQ